MTREEAIIRLKQNKEAAEFYAEMIGNYKSTENELKDIEALDMAIEALSADGDLISREDAIKKMITDNLVGGIDEFNAYKDKVVVSEWLDCLRDCVSSLEDAPSVSAEPNKSCWIPCSERLPEEYEWIGTKKFGTTISDTVHITFDVNGERFVKTLSLQNGELSNYEKPIMDTLYKGWKMLAWMPLPKPYEGGDDE